MILNLTALSIVLIAMTVGYRKGLLFSMLSLMAIICSYGAAIYFSKPLGNYLNNYPQLSGIIAYPIAGTMIFMGVFLLFQIIIPFVKYLKRTRKNKTGKSSTGSKIGGALLYGIVGFAVSLLIVWSIGFAKEFFPDRSGRTHQKQWIEILAGDLFAYVGNNILNSLSMNDTVLSRLISTLIADPGKSRQIQSLLDNPVLADVLNNPQFQKNLQSGDLAKIMEDPGFRRLLGDEQVAKALQDLELSEGTSEKTSPEESLAGGLADIGEKLANIKSDPDMQGIFNKPEVQEMIQERDFASMLRNKDMLDVLGQLMSSDPQKHTSENDVSRFTKEKAKRDIGGNRKTDNSKIYRWVDDEGTLHITDTKPP